MQRKISGMNVGMGIGLLIVGLGVLGAWPAGASGGMVEVAEISAPSEPEKGKAAQKKVTQKKAVKPSVKRAVKRAKPAPVKRSASKGTRSKPRVVQSKQGPSKQVQSKRSPSKKQTKRPSAMASGPTSGHSGGHSSGGHSSGRSAGHSSGRSSGHASPTRSGHQPSRSKAKPSAKPSPKPSSHPGTRPSTHPSTKPSTRPSTKPSTHPGTKPGIKPNTRPSTRPGTGVGTRPGGVRPGTRVNPRSTPSTGPTTRSTRSPGVTTLPGGSGGVVNQGTRRSVSTGLTGRPVVRSNDTPRGFDIEQARNAFISRTKPKADNGPKGRNTDGGKSGVGGLGAADDGVGDGADDSAHTDGDEHADHDPDNDGDHDNDHDGSFDDDEGHGNGHLGNHHYYNPYYSYYTHYSSPYGWWYIYGDFDGDGYTDYVVTNGSHSVYWYGWSGYYWGASPWYGFYGNGYSWWNNSVPGHYRGPINGTNTGLTTDPAYSTTPADVDSMPEAMPLSALEVARLEMSVGDPEIAVDAYRAHLSEYPNDWIAVRELGIAKIRVGNRGDGVALVNYAYAMDPELARSVVPTSIFADSERALRDAVVSVVGWGNRNPSPSAWLSVAVLMQAEGRDGPALKMIERAAGYGLDPMVVTEMRAALVRR